MKIKVLILLLSALLVTGCGSQIHALNYAPSSIMEVEGAANITDFKYKPSENNDKVLPNQIRNTAIGTILFDKNVSEYFKAAVFNEARLVGIKMDKSASIISGEINELLVDDLGYSSDWTIDVKYVVTRSSNEECYNKAHKLEKRTAKFTDFFGTLNELVKLNIEMAFKDSKFRDCLS